MIVNNWFRPSYSVYNSWQYLWCNDSHTRVTAAVVWYQSLTAGCILRPSGRGSECGNWISSVNFYAVFHSNCGSIALSFSDTTPQQTTDDGETDVGKHCISGPYDGPAINISYWLSLLRSSFRVDAVWVPVNKLGGEAPTRVTEGDRWGCVPSDDDNWRLRYEWWLCSCPIHSMYWFADFA